MMLDLIQQPQIPLQPSRRSFDTDSSSMPVVAVPDVPPSLSESPSDTIPPRALRARMQATLACRLQSRQQQRPLTSPYVSPLQECTPRSNTSKLPALLSPLTAYSSVGMTSGLPVSQQRRTPDSDESTSVVVPSAAEPCQPVLCPEESPSEDLGNLHVVDAAAVPVASGRD